MALRGPRPKPAGQARNRNPLVHGWIEVESTPFDGGPDLPPRRISGESWPASTVEKWQARRSMPHCRLWSASDWQFALDTIELAARFDDGGPVGLATELRNRERVMALSKLSEVGAVANHISLMRHI